MANPLKSVIFKWYSSEKLIALNTHHEVVPTWYSFHSTVDWRMQIKCLPQGYDILIPDFEPSTSVSRNGHSNHMTNMLPLVTNSSSDHDPARRRIWISSYFFSAPVAAEKSDSVQCIWTTLVITALFNLHRQWLRKNGLIIDIPHYSGELDQNTKKMWNAHQM